MNRENLKKIAQVRLEDASFLLEQGRWHAAYYLLGYVVECGLKACLLKYLFESDKVFGDEKYLKELGKCWTHELTKLVNMAGLDETFGKARQANVDLDAMWVIVNQWTETSRYEFRSESDARALHEAVTHSQNGVFPWIQLHW